ncbi:hypothetical protein [Saccharopolyspora spinosa]|uniref:hypothetical protein n=1 Tax=Saccharopolyspora spinosa TaxID=60894 RepID=UPI00193351E3|nr:hypothetical protein [Saccharopolyspora spinosa]
MVGDLPADQEFGRAERVTPVREALRAAAKTYGKPISEAEFNDVAARYGIWQGY